MTFKLFSLCLPIQTDSLKSIPFVDEVLIHLYESFVKASLTSPMANLQRFLKMCRRPGLYLIAQMTPVTSTW